MTVSPTTPLPSAQGVAARGRKDSSLKRVSLLFMIGGILLAIGLVSAFGAQHVLDALLSVGWAGFAALTLAQLGLDVVLSTAWRTIIPGRYPGLMLRLYWARLVREAGGRLLPFLPVGGFVIGARAVSLLGLPMPIAAASTLVDVAAEFMAEVLFALVGLVILIFARPDSDLILPLGAGIGVAALAAAIFIALPGQGTRLVRRLALRIGAAEGRALGSLDAMSLQFDAIYARKAAILGAIGLHFLAWLGSGLLSWLAYRLLGAPITILQALAIEALLRAALTMTFFVPGNAGVQEAAFAALGAIFGFPVQISIAVSLLTRGRDLVIGLPALLLWQYFEIRHMRSDQRRPLSAPPVEN